MIKSKLILQIYFALHTIVSDNPLCWSSLHRVYITNNKWISGMFFNTFDITTEHFLFRVNIVKSSNHRSSIWSISHKQKYLTINFTHLIHKARQIQFPFTNQCHCLHSQLVPSSSSHSLLTFQSSSLPFHNVSSSSLSSSSVSSNACDINHSLKPFTITSDELPHHDPHH